MGDHFWEEFQSLNNKNKTKILPMVVLESDHFDVAYGGAGD